MKKLYQHKPWFVVHVYMFWYFCLYKLTIIDYFFTCGSLQLCCFRECKQYQRVIIPSRLNQTTTTFIKKMTRNRDPETFTTMHSPSCFRAEMTSSKLIQACTTICMINPFNYQLTFMTSRKGYLCHLFQQIKIIQSFKTV